MSFEPKCAQKGSYKIQLPAGEHAWCACGLSNTQPLCDGSHGTCGITPMSFKLDAPKMVSLCGCKQSANKPFCDGAHNRMK